MSTRFDRRGTNRAVLNTIQCRPLWLGVLGLFSFTITPEPSIIVFTQTALDIKKRAHGAGTPCAFWDIPSGGGLIDSNPTTSALSTQGDVVSFLLLGGV